MPGVERLHLEDAFEDSPQTKNLIGVFRKDADLLKNYSSGLNQCCSRLLTAQREVSEATRLLSQQLKVYDQHRFPLESEGSILSETLQQFIQYFDELSSSHQIMAAQLEDGIFPLQKFIQADLEEVSRVGSMFDMSTNDLEESLVRYMKLSKKKDNEKIRMESAQDVYAMKKKFHQTALHMYASLNSLQYKRKMALLEPLVRILLAQKAFYELGKETICKPEVDQFLANINASIQGVRAEMTDDTNRTVELMDAIEQNSVLLYPVEAAPDTPYRVPSTNLTQKGGYLFLRSQFLQSNAVPSFFKTNILNTKWERFYFFIQGGNLMSQSRNEVAGSLVLDLNEEGVIAEPLDCDDRRHVFQVICVGSKKSIILQAECVSDRDEWIATINNAAREGGYVRGDASGAGAARTSPPKNVTFNLTASKETGKSSSGDTGEPRSGPASSTPPSTSAESNFQFEVPIQFDIITPNNDERYVMPKEGPQRRINPFDESTDRLVEGEAGTDSAAFSQTFVVRFLGSMEVRTDRGERLILDTMQQVMAARAIHNVFKTTESHLVVSQAYIRLVDPSNSTIRVQFPLEDISFWAAHFENKKLLGFITRTRGTTEHEKPKYTCHVFDCNASAEEICHAITNATKLAYQSLIESKTRQKEEEKNILLANISQLDDLEDSDDNENEAPPLPAKSADLDPTSTTGDAPSDVPSKSVRFAADSDNAPVQGQGDDLPLDIEPEGSPLPLSPDGKFVLLDAAGVDQSEASTVSVDVAQSITSVEEPESDA